MAQNSNILTDAVGNTFAPADAAAGTNVRIASFVPSITELLIDLGLTDQLVARTQICIHPAGTVERIPAIGGTKKVSLPKLKALRPTHAILNVDENTREMASALQEFVPNVVVTHPLEPDDNLDLFALMGGLFGVADKADEIAGYYRAASAAVSNLPVRPPLKVLYFIWNDPWMTVSRDTYISAMLRRIGWHTTHHDPDTRYPVVNITPEVIDATDLFLFSTEPYAFTQADIDAFSVRYGCPIEKMLLIDGEYCSWYGSRAVAGLHYLHGLAGNISSARHPKAPGRAV